MACICGLFVFCCIFLSLASQAKELRELEGDQELTPMFTTVLQTDNVNEECDCGDNSLNCTIIKGGIIECQCAKGYAQKDDKCADCNCGNGTKFCIFNVEGHTFCECEEGYFLKNGRCEKCDCGVNSDWCQFLDNGKKLCGCKILYDQKDNMCQDCRCGANTTTCLFANDGSKVCSCDKGFSLRLGVCTECNCGANSFVSMCHYKEKGELSCACNLEYYQKDGRCVRGPNVGAIIGGVLGALTAIILIGLAGFLIYYKKYRGRS